MNTLRLRPTATLAALLLVAGPLAAFQPVEEPATAPLARVYAAPELAVEPTLEELGDLQGAALRPELAAFLRSFGPDWIARWDRRSDRPHLLQGSGVAIVPGFGNGLLPADVGLLSGEAVTLELVAGRLQGFVAAYPELLGVEGFDLRLDRARSTSFGGGNSHWFLEFAQFQDGVPVEGANVFFRLSHGNLVQFGTDRVAPVAIETRPALERSDALAAALRELELPHSSLLGEVLDGGSLHLYPIAPATEAPGEHFAGVAGTGYDHLLAWKFVFRLPGEAATYQVLLDAHLNRVLEVRDLNAYADATVSGGVYPVTNTDPEVVVNFPFATLTNGGTKITDANGIYDYSPPGSTATIALNGQYFRMVDACGAISLANATDGNLAFGTSGGTDCTTPGFGGAGNTHASRSGFYHLTKINRKADSYFPANAWIDSKVTANMNINQTCNAFWNGSTVNFYRSGGGCSNTGELAAVFLHEWGHGMDTNTGGAANENGSGEAVGDTFAFLETRDGCIGQNFIPSQNCHNCTACTGVRDVSDFDISGPAVIARPSNVTHNSGINCDRFACPYFVQGVFPYQGPMGYEGHCEAVIAGSANWDLTQMLIAEHGTEPGWAAMDRIWYGSLTPSKSAYRLVSGGQCNAAAVVDGCGATNWYTVFLPADDDDGNLANGTPNACRIWDAFSAHGIACGARPVCSCAQPATADAGPDVAICQGGSTTIGTPALPDHTYSWSPGGATTAQILVSPGTTTVYTLTTTTSCDQGTDAVTVTVNGPPPTADAGADVTICEGDSTTIGTPALPDHTYSWTPGGATTAQVLVSPVIDTTYTVTATTTCSSIDDAVDVFVNHPPASPALTSPANGAVGVDPPIVLVWAATPDATSYLAELATDAAFVNVVGSANTAFTNVNFGSLPLGTYFWRVTPSGSCPGGVVSATFSFTVDNILFIDGFETNDTTAWSVTVP
jgi:hypothetical protein